MFITQVTENKIYYTTSVKTYCCLIDCDAYVVQELWRDLVDASDGMAIKYATEKNERAMVDHLTYAHNLYTEDAWRNRVDGEMRPFMNKLMVMTDAYSSAGFDVIRQLREHFMQRDIR